MDTCNDITLRVSQNPWHTLGYITLGAVVIISLPIVVSAAATAITGATAATGVAPAIGAGVVIVKSMKIWYAPAIGEFASSLLVQYAPGTPIFQVVGNTLEKITRYSDFF